MAVPGRDAGARPVRPRPLAGCARGVSGGQPRLGAPLGLVSAYQADLANGSCYLAMLGDPEQPPSGAVLEAAGLFISYLFHT